MRRFFGHRRRTVRNFERALILLHHDRGGDRTSVHNLDPFPPEMTHRMEDGWRVVIAVCAGSSISPSHTIRRWRRTRSRGAGADRAFGGHGSRRARSAYRASRRASSVSARSPYDKGSSARRSSQARRVFDRRRRDDRRCGDRRFRPASRHTTPGVIRRRHARGSLFDDMRVDDPGPDESRVDRDIDRHPCGRSTSCWPEARLGSSGSSARGGSRPRGCPLVCRHLSDAEQLGRHLLDPRDLVLRGRRTVGARRGHDDAGIAAFGYDARPQALALDVLRACVEARGDGGHRRPWRRYQRDRPGVVGFRAVGGDHHLLERLPLTSVGFKMPRADGRRLRIADDRHDILPGTASRWRSRLRLQAAVVPAAGVARRYSVHTHRDVVALMITAICEDHRPRTRDRTAFDLLTDNARRCHLRVLLARAHPALLAWRRPGCCKLATSIALTVLYGGAATSC